MVQVSWVGEARATPRQITAPHERHTQPAMRLHLEANNAA